MKREIRHFHVVVVHRRQKKYTQIVMHVQSCCFANPNLLLYCRSCCRLRRCCLSSLIVLTQLRGTNPVAYKNAWHVGF